MRKIIEYTLVSIDGVFEDPARLGFMGYRDDAYLRDGLGILLACDAMLMGRNTYESFAKIWPSRSDPWAARLNAMQKYVFSSTLEKADWSNSTIDDVVAEVSKLKQQEGRDLLSQDVAHRSGGRIGDAENFFLVVARGGDERQFGAVLVPLHVRPFAAAAGHVIAQRGAVLVSR